LPAFFGEVNGLSTVDMLMTDTRKSHLAA
jgi:hypothetical protein